MKRRRELKSKSTSSPKVDKTLLYLILVLLTIGLVFIADISAPQALNFFDDRFYFLKQQVMWAGIGLVAMFVVSFINYNFSP